MPKYTEFDWKSFDKLLNLNPSLDFCCAQQLTLSGKEVDKRTLRNMRAIIETRVKKRFGMTFQEYRHFKLENVRLEILQNQISVALKGKVPMLIWLGKTLCGQTERTVEDRSGATYVVIDKFTEGKIVGQTELQTLPTG